MNYSLWTCSKSLMSYNIQFINNYKFLLWPLPGPAFLLFFLCPAIISMTAVGKVIRKTLITGHICILQGQEHDPRGFWIWNRENQANFHLFPKVTYSNKSIFKAWESERYFLEVKGRKLKSRFPWKGKATLYAKEWLSNLLKHRFLSPAHILLHLWLGWGSAFLRAPQVMLMQLVQKPQWSKKALV